MQAHHTASRRGSACDSSLAASLTNPASSSRPSAIPVSVSDCTSAKQSPVRPARSSASSIGKARSFTRPSPLMSVQHHDAALERHHRVAAYLRHRGLYLYLYLAFQTDLHGADCHALVVDGDLVIAYLEFDAGHRFHLDATRAG